MPYRKISQSDARKLQMENELLKGEVKRLRGDDTWNQKGLAWNFNSQNAASYFAGAKEFNPSVVLKVNVDRESGTLKIYAVEVKKEAER